MMMQVLDELDVDQDVEGGQEEEDLLGGTPSSVDSKKSITNLMRRNISEKFGLCESTDDDDI